MLEYKVKDLNIRFSCLTAALPKLAQYFDGEVSTSGSRTNEAHWFRKTGKRKFCGYGKHCGVVESDVDSNSGSSICSYGYKDNLLNLSRWTPHCDPHFLDGFVPSKNLSYVPNFKKSNSISIGHCPRIKDWKWWKSLNLPGKNFSKNLKLAFFNPWETPH